MCSSYAVRPACASISHVLQSRATQLSAPHMSRPSKTGHHAGCYAVSRSLLHTTAMCCAQPNTKRGSTLPAAECLQKHAQVLGRRQSASGSTRKHSGGTRALWRYQSTLPVPEHSAGTRALCRYQSTLAVPEHSGGTRALCRYQSTLPVPEHSAGTRALWRYQSTLPVPEHSAGTRALCRYQSTLPVPESFRLLPEALCSCQGASGSTSSDVSSAARVNALSLYIYRYMYTY